MLVKDNPYIPKEDKDFFILLRVGLWQKVEEPLSATPDWAYIYRLSYEQTVQGIVCDGIGLYLKEHPDLAITQDENDLFVASATHIISRNLVINKKQAEINELFKHKEITFVIIKGQGLALNYPKPNLRCSGDIDYLLPANHYHFAKDLLSKYASRIGDEYKKNMHWDANIDGIEVELHGTALSFFLRKADDMLIKFQEDMFDRKDFNKKSCDGGKTIFYTPNFYMDILYTFFHILKHIVQGLGLRQLCDLAVMLKAYDGKYGKDKLLSTLKEMGLTKYWYIIISFCIDYLGMEQNIINIPKFYPQQELILWSNSKRNGNFGHKFQQGVENMSSLQRKIANIKSNLVFAKISKRIVFRRTCNQISSYFKIKLFR